MDAFSFINVECKVEANVEIGAYSLLAPRVSLITLDHIFDRPGTPIIFAGRPSDSQSIVIEDDVWVGTGSIVLPGIRIGRGAIVGAGSVVTKNVPPFEIHAGTPAKFVRKRFNEKEQAIHEKMLNQSPNRGEYCNDR